MNLVFATQNPNKLQEVKQMLPPALELMSLTEIGFHDDIPETEPTLQGNALKKARFIYSKFGCNCFSDDTGLEIDAIGGRPGVYSARYAGEQKDSKANMQKVLDELKGISNRRARFKTVIALIIGNEEMLFEGIAEGQILESPQGKEGFGYDPIFQPIGYDRSFAQMPLSEKNLISHRYKAFRMLADYLMSYNYF